MKSIAGETERQAEFREIHARLQRGDHEAMDLLIARFWSAVMRFCWVRVRASDAHDVTQEVFLSTYKTVRQGRGPQTDDPAEWRRYLIRSARHRIIDYYRRKGSGPPLQLQSDLMTATPDMEPSFFQETHTVGCDEPLISAEQQEAINECMSTLDVVGRMMCWLFFVEGKSKREIGRLTTTPESTVRVLIAEAVQNLRRCLEAKGQAPA